MYEHIGTHKHQYKSKTKQNNKWETLKLYQNQ